MTERRYSREEVEQIFASAADAQELGQGGTAGSAGLTLAEMQEIGLEAGLSPDAIARAAAGVALPAPDSISGRMLGLPIRVGETAELGRRLTDEEWERVVVLLRDTFNAHGKVDASGSLRQWTNGNLQALLEPGTDGHRIRLQTYNQQARMFMGFGIVTLGIGVTTAISAVIGGVFTPESMASLGGVFVMGSGFFVVGAARLPGWARTRRQQMRDIIAQLRDTIDTKQLDTPTTTGEAS
jgi:hypothetical protein